MQKEPGVAARQIRAAQALRTATSPEHMLCNIAKAIIIPVVYGYLADRPPRTRSAHCEELLLEAARCQPMHDMTPPCIVKGR